MRDTSPGVPAIGESLTYIGYQISPAGLGETTREIISSFRAHNLPFSAAATQEAEGKDVSFCPRINFYQVWGQFSLLAIVEHINHRVLKLPGHVGGLEKTVSSLSYTLQPKGCNNTFPGIMSPNESADTPLALIATIKLDNAFQISGRLAKKMSLFGELAQGIDHIIQTSRIPARFSFYGSLGWHELLVVFRGQTFFELFNILSSSIGESSLPIESLHFICGFDLNALLPVSEVLMSETDLLWAVRQDWKHKMASAMRRTEKVGVSIHFDRPPTSPPTIGTHALDLNIAIGKAHNIEYRSQDRVPVESLISYYADTFYPSIGQAAAVVSREHSTVLHLFGQKFPQLREPSPQFLRDSLLVDIDRISSLEHLRALPETTQSLIGSALDLYRNGLHIDSAYLNFLPVHNFVLALEHYVPAKEHVANGEYERLLNKWARRLNTAYDQLNFDALSVFSGVDEPKIDTTTGVQKPLLALWGLLQYLLRPSLRNDSGSAKGAAVMCLVGTNEPIWTDTLYEIDCSVVFVPPQLCYEAHELWKLSHEAGHVFDSFDRKLFVATTLLDYLARETLWRSDYENLVAHLSQIPESRYAIDRAQKSRQDIQTNLPSHRSDVRRFKEAIDAVASGMRPEETHLHQAVVIDYFATKGTLVDPVVKHASEIFADLYSYTFFFLPHSTSSEDALADCLRLHWYDFFDRICDAPRNHRAMHLGWHEALIRSWWISNYHAALSDKDFLSSSLKLTPRDEGCGHAEYHFDSLLSSLTEHLQRLCHIFASPFEEALREQLVGLKAETLAIETIFLNPLHVQAAYQVLLQFVAESHSALSSQKLHVETRLVETVRRMIGAAKKAWKLSILKRFLGGPEGNTEAASVLELESHRNAPDLDQWLGLAEKQHTKLKEAAEDYKTVHAPIVDSYVESDNAATQIILDWWDYAMSLLASYGGQADTASLVLQVAQTTPKPAFDKLLEAFKSLELNTRSLSIE